MQMGEYSGGKTTKFAIPGKFTATSIVAGILPYIDVVEEALCFGWIDSTLKKLSDGRLAQRLSPRRKNSHWTKLNMDRCIDLEDRGLMTPAGRRALNFVDKRGTKTL